MSAQINNIRPEFDREIVDIVDYVMNYEISSKVAYDTAHYCLLDTLGCGLEALEYPACKKLLGPIVPGTVVPNGVRVPGTQFQLDPVQAAFNIGAMIRWLDFNDTRLAAEWGASFRQPRRHSGNGGLAFAQCGRQRQSAVDHETGTDRNDQSP